MFRAGNHARVGPLLAAAFLTVSTTMEAQHAPDAAHVSVIYTGRSFGALGVRRAQEEHELLTEQANARGLAFKLVSHLAWRAPGLVILLPGQEPEGDELAYTLANLADVERIDSVPALISANVLLVQDPWRPQPDLMSMLKSSPRLSLDFPDLVETTVAFSRLRTPRDQRVFIVEQLGAEWPPDTSGWTVGEMNRVDVAESRLFELPLNLGAIGPRATLLRRLAAESPANAGDVLLADLGHQQGDFGVPPYERARLDFTALTRLGYRFSVPFEFELSLGAESLGKLKREFGTLEMLAANVVAPSDSTLFAARRVVRAAGVRIGLLGLVGPDVRYRLPRHRLVDFVFRSPVEAAREQIALLRADSADVIIVLSNMDPRDNAILATDVVGIDVILADLPTRWAPEIVQASLELPERPLARPGAPALVARSASNGVAVGRLDLEVRTGGAGRGPYLARIRHRLEPVTDRIPPDSELVRLIADMANLQKGDRGELMFPAFVDLAERHPHLWQFDEVTAQGRVSKGMWEAFMARLLRLRSQSEIAVIRRLEQFPPLIGKLHENEIGQWLWTEDEIVTLDVLGSDLRELLRADSRNQLATSGLDRDRWTVHGHLLDDRTYYRVATVDVLYEGARSFTGGRRVRQRFAVGRDGLLTTPKNGEPLALRDFVFGELRRIRSELRGSAHIDAIAQLVTPDTPHSNLLAFTFDRPTLWASSSRVRGADGYGAVPESRVTGRDAWVAGGSGRFVVTQERQRNAVDVGLSLAYARQGFRSAGASHVGESADDIKLDVTVRPSALAGTGGRIRPFVRGLLDSELTPTEDPVTAITNPRQMLLRGSGGLLRMPGRHWRRAELAVAVEEDLGQHNLQFGIQSAADFILQIGVPGGFIGTRPTYRVRNDLTYLLPSSRDGPTNLALRYNMVHEILIPLVDELSLSVAADFFFFQGKTAATRRPGVSTLIRAGVTYDRLWKPRYQPFL